MCGTATYPPYGALAMECSLFPTSTPFVVGSYLSPTFSVKDRDTFQSSCAYIAKCHSRKPRAASFCGFPLASGRIPLKEKGIPCRNSARLWKLQLPCPGMGDHALDCTRLA